MKHEHRLKHVEPPIRPKVLINLNPRGKLDLFKYKHNKRTLLALITFLKAQVVHKMIPMFEDFSMNMKVGINFPQILIYALFNEIIYCLMVFTTKTAFGTSYAKRK